MVHQSGEKHLEALRSNYRNAGVDGELVAFIDDMARRYAEATWSSAARAPSPSPSSPPAGVASILVPFPHAVDDHQTRQRALPRRARRRAARAAGETARAQKLAQLVAHARRANAARDGAQGARARQARSGARVVAQRCMELASMKHKVRHIHFVGIGGAGMCGIAEVLLNRATR